MKYNPFESNLLTWNLQVAKWTAGLAYLAQWPLANWWNDLSAGFDLTNGVRTLVTDPLVGQTVTFKQRGGVTVLLPGTTPPAERLDRLVHYGVNPEPGGGKVFVNFQATADAIIENILSISEGVGPYLFVGHSLGGAVAHVLAHRMIASGKVVVGVYTYGCPKVGDQEYVDKYIENAWNIQHTNDIVPDLPPDIFATVPLPGRGVPTMPLMHIPGRPIRVGADTQRPNAFAGNSVASFLTRAANMGEVGVRSHLMGNYFNEIYALGRRQEVDDFQVVKNIVAAIRAANIPQP